METKKMNQHEVETLGSASAKLLPPAGVGVLQLFGVHVSELVLWLTLLYTVLLVAQKVWQMSVAAYAFWVLKQRPWNKPAEDE